MIYMSIADLQLIWFSSAAAFYPKRIKLVICQPVQSFRVNEINESFLYLESGSSAADCATSWNPVHQFFYLFYFLILSFNGCWIIYILSTGPGEIVDYFLNILYYQQLATPTIQIWTFPMYLKQTENIIKIRIWWMTQIQT